MLAQIESEIAPLFRQIEAWCDEAGWQSEIRPATTAETLVITTPEGRVNLEPVGQDRADRFVVEMYAYPTLNRVFLKKKPQAEGWEIFTDTGIPFYREWNRPNFITLAHDMQAVP